jgi:hypothetical protein
VYRFAPASRGLLKSVTVKQVSGPSGEGDGGEGGKRELEWKRAAVKEALSELPTLEELTPSRGKVHWQGVQGVCWRDGHVVCCVGGRSVN